MVLVWTPYGVRAFPLAPAVSPREPEPSARLTYVPPSVSAVVWTGIPEVAFDRAGISLNGRPLYSMFTAPDTLVGYVQPPIRVGTWTLTADIFWPGGSSTTTWTVTLDPPPPLARFDTHPRDPLFAGHTIRFDAGASSAQVGAIVAYVWDFGDGSAATGPVVNHTYGEPGEYIVTLSVSTDIGQTVTESRTLLVQTLTTVPREFSIVIGNAAGAAAGVVALALSIVLERVRRRRREQKPLNPEDPREDPASPGVR